MIHLITLNPAIDEYIEVDKLMVGQTSYRKSTTKVVGGKAVNVASVLKSLGQNATLITTVDNRNSFVADHLNTFNSFLIEVDSIRTNLKINDNGHITEINDRGNPLSAMARLQFEHYVSKNIASDDLVLIAGNPHPDDEQFQFKLAMIAKARGAVLFLDSNKFNLEMIKQIKPEFIKPNDEELEVLVGTDGTAKELTEYAKQLIVSHGGKGFTYFNQELEKYEQPITGTPVNTVGAGDSLVAGYIYATVNNLDLSNSLLFAKYCASATVYSGKLATYQTIKEYDTTNIID